MSMRPTSKNIFADTEEPPTFLTEILWDLTRGVKDLYNSPHLFFPKFQKRTDSPFLLRPEN